MENYLDLVKTNLKISILPHFLICILLSIVSPLFMGVECLDELQVAKIMEVYFSLMGIIMLVPIFTAEQNRNIRDLVSTKKISTFKIYLLRLSMSILIIIGVFTIYLIFLKGQESIFPFFKLLFGSFITALFLGSIGLFFYAITDNMVVGYMMPVFYYILNFGSGQKFLGYFYIFSMMRGQFLNKWWLFVTGILLMVFSLLIKGNENKRR